MIHRLERRVALFLTLLVLLGLIQAGAARASSIAAAFAAPGPIVRPAAAQMEWESSLADGLQRAATENRAVFIAVNMDGEPVCEQLAEKYYRDKRLLELSRHMVCLFASKYFHRGGTQVCSRAGKIPCADHQQVEKDLRREVMKLGAGSEMIAPNHIFLDPQGQVLFSVPYMLTKGELEWCMVEAIRKVTPSFAWNLSSSARGPRRLVYGEVLSPGQPGGGASAAHPLSEEELDEVIKAFNRSGRGDRQSTIRQYFPSLILTNDKRAMSEVSNLLTSRWVLNRGRTPEMLREIGRSSPPAFWSVVAPFVSHADLSVRNDAIVALELLGEPKALKVLTKQRSAEKEDSAKANLIRAIAAVGAGVRSAESLVLKTAARDKKEFQRINALVGLVHVENREKVNEVLLKALNDKGAGIRAAAAYTTAVRREKDLYTALEAARDVESDRTCKTYLDAALGTLNGGGLRLVEGVLREYALEEIPRERD